MAISTGLERIGAPKGTVVRNPTKEHHSCSGSASVLVAGMTAGLVATLVVAGTIVAVVVVLILVDISAAVRTKQRSAR